MLKLSIFTKFGAGLIVSALMSSTVNCAIAQTASEMAHPLFTDSKQNNSSFEGDIARAPNGDPSFGGTNNSIRVWPKGWDWTVFKFNQVDIDGSNNFLHFYLRRGDDGAGTIKMQANSYMDTIALDGTNALAWSLNGITPSTSFSSIADMPAHHWNHFVVDLNQIGISELNSLVIQGANDDVIYYMDEVGLHTNADLFSKSLFLDDFSQGAAEWENEGNVQLESNGYGANGSQTSLLIQPEAYDYSGLTFFEAIDSNKRYLHFSFQRAVDSDGKFALIPQNWGGVFLDNSNTNAWTVNGAPSNGSFEDLSPNQWHDITVDLQELNLTFLNAVGVLGDNNDSPSVGGGNYFLDNIGFSSEPFGSNTTGPTPTTEAPNRCVNIGGFLESPVLDPENAIFKKWGYPNSTTGKPSMPVSDLQAIKDAGFDTIRLPIRWTRFAGEEANLIYGNDDHFPYGSSVQNPYSNTHGTIETIDDNPIDTSENSIFPIVDEILEDAQAIGLKVIINVHLPKGFTYDRTENQLADLDNETLRLKAIWKQLAIKYASEEDTLFFELLNEPIFGPDDYSTGTYVNLINNLNAELINIIRSVPGNEERWVIAGSSRYGGITPFQASKQHNFVPPNDSKTIMTFHYYEPFDFTHQTMDFPLFSNWSYENGAIEGDPSNYSIINDQGGALRSASYVKVTHSQGWEFPTIQLEDQPNNNVKVIGTNNRYLHLEVRRETGGSNSAGRINLQNQNWSVITLDSSNASLWTPDELPLQTGLNELPSGEWHHIVIDLQKLGVTTLNGFGIQADGNAGEIYGIDEIGLHNSPIFPAPFIANERRSDIELDFDDVVTFQNQNAPDMPVFVGEFGSKMLSDAVSRKAFAQTIREEAEERGFGWCAWDFGTYSTGGMAIYNPDTGEWIDGFKDALIPE